MRREIKKERSKISKKEILQSDPEFIKNLEKNISIMKSKISSSEIERIYNNIEKMDRVEQKQELENMFNKSADHFMLRKVEVEIYHGQKNDYGYYGANDRKVHVNDLYLTQKDFAETIDTLHHEGWHAYQDDIMRDPRLLKEHPEFYREAEILRANDVGYVSPETGWLYFTQPAENEAFFVGETVKQHVESILNKARR